MANEHLLEVAAHPSIYQHEPRNMKLYFCEPEQGVTADTGLLLLIPDFGEILSDEKSAKMRQSLADDHNMVTIQCEHFGYEFMGGYREPIFQFDVQAIQKVLSPAQFETVYRDGTIDVSALLEVGKTIPLDMIGFEQMNETLSNFNDMGIMQAVDQLSAVQIVIEILKDNQLSFNAGKIMAVGSGHGAYLAYLCNALAPRLFRLIVDFTGRLFPSYLESNRSIHYRNGESTMTVVYSYLASKLDNDRELLHLPSLYRRLTNQCDIVAFHRSDDDSRHKKQKQSFCQSLKNCTFSEIAESDPVSLFKYALENIRIPIALSTDIQLPVTSIHTKRYRYQIDFSGGVPILERLAK